MTRLHLKAAGIGLAALIVTTAVAAAFRDTLVVNGKSTSVDVRTIGGSTYVKLADVARALDMTLVKRGDGRYELTKEGGANQVGSLTGKLGDTLFDGKWRFTAISVDTPDTYTMKFESEPYDFHDYSTFDRPNRVIKPAKGYSLIVVKVRVANGVKERRTLWTAINDEKVHTAIADSDGSSHVPVAYDYQGGPNQTEWLLPGAQLTFNVIFSVPEGTKAKDLIFTLKNNQGDEKGVDVRVSLAGS